MHRHVLFVSHEFGYFDLVNPDVHHTGNHCAMVEEIKLSESKNGKVHANIKEQGKLQNMVQAEQEQEEARVKQSPIPTD